MKSLVFILTLLASLGSFAGDPMTEEEKSQYLEKVAKEIRQSYWVQGYQNIESRSLRLSKADIDEHIRSERNERYDQALQDHEIARLYGCHYEPKCEVQAVFITGSYHSGWVRVAHFILLDTMSPRHNSIVHTMEAE